MTADTPQNRGTTKDGHHPRTKTSPRKAAFWIEASGVLAIIQASMKADAATGTMVRHSTLQTTLKVLRWKEKKRLKEGKKELRRTVWLCGTGHKGERFGTRKSERFRGDREETLGNCIALVPQQSERQLELHVQAEFGSEQQSIRFESEDVGGIGPSGRSVRDVRGHVALCGTGVRCRRHVVRFIVGRS